MNPLNALSSRELMNRIVTFIGSFGYTGFFPVAPATFASFIFLVIYILIPGGRVLAGLHVFIITLVLSIPTAARMEVLFGHDARCIVIDEIAGMQMILVGAATGFAGALAAYFLFRIFDVLKPFPAGISQKLPGGLGVVADDLIAGLYARLVLVILSVIFPIFGDFGWP